VPDGGVDDGKRPCRHPDPQMRDTRHYASGHCQAFESIWLASHE
jgi:hypothetical protein